ncbi:Regulator of G-protein signaling 20 [Myotis brandtii]|uniref:Regulator of G-protein signaling 20 n=1 Tax=Myotis brandtii TaxID=109478 RepID=S7NWV8_MYOBR|nr:Regulator of G-protein signaling 20 [Myotis brandtii]
MTRLSQDNQECLQKHFRRPSMRKQFLPLQRAEAYNANIHQTTEKEGATEAAYDIKLISLKSSDCHLESRGLKERKDQHRGQMKVFPQIDLLR